MARLLVGSGLLSAVVLWWEPVDSTVAASLPADATGVRTDAVAATSATSAMPPMPATLESFRLPAIVGDPFDDAPAPPAPPPVAPLAPAPSTPVAAPVPTPAAAAPPLNYRYLGTLVGTDAQPRVFLADGERHHELAAGSRLPDGYVVETLGPGSIRLRHALTDTVADIPLPPSTEVRP